MGGKQSVTDESLTYLDFVSSIWRMGHFYQTIGDRLIGHLTRGFFFYLLKRFFVFHCTAIIYLVYFMYSLQKLRV